MLLKFWTKATTTLGKSGYNAIKMLWDGRGYMGLLADSSYGWCSRFSVIRFTLEIASCLYAMSSQTKHFSVGLSWIGALTQWDLCAKSNSYRSLYDYSQIQTSYTKHITKSKTAKICKKHIEIQANIKSTETILLQFKKKHCNKTTKLHVHDSKCSWIATWSCE